MMLKREACVISTLTIIQQGIYMDGGEWKEESPKYLLIGISWHVCVVIKILLIECVHIMLRTHRIGGPCLMNVSTTSYIASSALLRYILYGLARRGIMHAFSCAYTIYAFSCATSKCLAMLETGIRIIILLVQSEIGNCFDATAVCSAYREDQSKQEIKQDCIYDDSSTK